MTKTFPKIIFLKTGYRLATGPNGHVSVCVSRKPHISYDLDMAALYGIIRLAA